MKKSGIHLTIVSVAVIAVSIMLAGLLSAMTPEGSYVNGENSSIGEEIQDNGNNNDDIDNEQDDTADDSGSDDLPAPAPVKGGLSGGNEEAVKSGRLPGFEDKDINSDPDIFCYLINSEVTMQGGDGSANIMAENDPGNNSPMQLCYYLEGSDELIYVSPMLQPDEHLDGDNINVKLKKGSHKVNAVISVYDNETMELKTTFHQAVNLTVKQKILGIF